VRALYVLATYLLLPVVLAIEGWQALRHRQQRGRIAQRLGFVPRARMPGSVWIHAVSVGEVQAAAALVKELRRRDSSLPIVLSTVTATGAERATALFKDTVQLCYLPYDLPGAMRRFVDRIAPRVAVILETELWPTLYGELRRRGIPLVIGSARLSEKSVRRYRRVALLVRSALSGNITIGAQTATDAERFRAIGAAPAQVHVTGNVKYDLEIANDQIERGRALRAQWGMARPVWIAGSTHEGEETAALTAHDSLRQRYPNALLVLVPRHPQRFEAVRELLDGRQVPYARRSRGEVPRTDQPVLLVDTLGELQMLYAAGDVAFVGGSLVPIGGHSLLEPAVLALPILSGPHTQNSHDVAELLRQADALQVVDDAEALGAAMLRWLEHPAEARAAGTRGRDAVAANRGAVGRLVALIEPLLVRSSDARPAASSAPSGSR
jgi:3-deoxy-D-manno-octulosonic-acid transferase